MVTSAVKRAWILVLACGALACAADAIIPPGPPVTLRIAEHPDSIGYGNFVQLNASAFDEAGRQVSLPAVSWSSSNERVLRVSPDGSVEALRPGMAIITVQAGALADRSAVIVTTSNCDVGHRLDADAHAFNGTTFWPGRTQGGSPTSNLTEYMGVPFLYGSGILFATHPDSTSIGHIYSHSSLADFDTEGGVCRTTQQPMHTVALLKPATWPISIGSAPSYPGLIVVQEQFAYWPGADDGYVLMKYEFTNARETTIQDLRVGYLVDFDVYEYGRNIGVYDLDTQAAITLHEDSTGRPVRAGLALIGRGVGSYRASLPATTNSRTQYYDLIAGSGLETGPTPVEDVKQVLAAPPMSLEPGETQSVWFAMAVGADHASLVQHLDLARLKVQELE